MRAHNGTEQTALATRSRAATIAPDGAALLHGQQRGQRHGDRRGVCDRAADAGGRARSELVQARPPTAFDVGINKVSWLLIKSMFVMVPVVFLLNGLTRAIGWKRSFSVSRWPSD